MKRIEAIIQPEKLQEVTDALKDLGVTGMTVLEARGFGRQMGRGEVIRYRGTEYRVDFVHKVMILLAVTDKMAPRVVECIIKTAKTGAIGDGKIFVSNLERAFRVRTEESGEDAL